MSAKHTPLRLHKAGHDPRAAALVALAQTLWENVDSQAALDGVLSSAALMPTDKRLCTELTYGVLRWHARLQAFSERFLSRPEKLPDEMRLALIAALYEMAFLRVPHHGPVNWAVRHVNNRFGKGLGGVANGALRSMQRALKEFHDPEQPLGVRYAMPEWIVDLWLHSYGENAALALLEAAQTAPPSGLRLNRAAPGWEALREMLRQESEAATHAVPPAALAFQGPLPWQTRDLLKEGKASRQSAASYEAIEAFTPASWPQPIWDCCAGRGGKTLALLEQGVPVALASDPSARRLQGLTEEYARLGLSAPPCPQTLSSAADAWEEPGGKNGTKSTPELPGMFGAILVDAPCSGLGTLARHPEIRLRRTPEDLQTLAATQRNILHSVWPRLRPGGFLIYLTCTVNPAENEEQIAAFAASHPDAVKRGEFRTPFDSPLREFFYGAALEKRE